MRYQRKKVTMDGIRRDIKDHVIIRGETDVRFPSGLPMTALIKDCHDNSLQQYLLGLKSRLKGYLIKAGWNGIGDIYVCDLGEDPTKEVAFHRATFFAQEVVSKRIFVSLPRDRADAAMGRLGISRVVGEA